MDYVVGQAVQVEERPGRWDSGFTFVRQTEHRTVVKESTSGKEFRCYKDKVRAAEGSPGTTVKASKRKEKKLKVITDKCMDCGADYKLKLQKNGTYLGDHHAKCKGAKAPKKKLPW